MSCPKFQFLLLTPEFWNLLQFLHDKIPSFFIHIFSRDESQESTRYVGKLSPAEFLEAVEEKIWRFLREKGLDSDFSLYKYLLIVKP